MEIKDICMGCMAEKGNADPCPYCGWSGEMHSSPQHLTPGTILRGKYLLGRALGQGGFGITYLARDLDLNLILAIKEYFPRDFTTRSAGDTQVSVYSSGDSVDFFNQGRDKFLEEARTLARFDEHPNIVSIRDFFRENGTAYFVMNYIDGTTFKDYIQENGGTLEFDKALQVMMPVIDALGQIHSAGVLHRDVSPDNIFITQKGIVKILDFGAARNAMSEHSKSLSVILKPGYAPEEQYRSKGNQGPWTDVYATAATFYRAIAGRVPPDALDRLAEDTLQRPSELGVKIPAHAEEVLMKALAVKASDRFSSMKEFQAELAKDWQGPRDIFGESSLAPAPVEVKEKGAKEIQARPGGSKRVLAVVGILLLIAALGGWVIKGKITAQYTGSTVGGQKDGYGVMIWPNGDRYEGEWKNDLQNGTGSFVYADGEKYEGLWKDGKKNGTGTYTWLDGRKYTGEWKDDLRNGKGEYTWPTGDRYVGEFKDGKMNGHGVYTYANGKIVEGIWQNDTYMGK